jgi:predicted small lipoprotein YifL
MRLGARSLVTALAAILAALTLSVCGKKSPSENTPVTTTPPTTAPPATQPTPVPTSCDRLGFVSPSNSCGSESPHYLPQLERAMDRLVAEHPEIFKLSESSGSGQYRVVSTGRYYVGLIKNLEAEGLCAGFDGEELGIKEGNAFNDQYHVMTSAFFMRRGQGSYRTTCSPAVFPTPPPPFPSNNGCPLPGSREVTCSREDGLYLADVDRAIVKVTQEHPDVFDLNTSAPGTGNWYAIRNADRFFELMVQGMISLGYCARYDGEELVVKKTNEFNEQYDIFAGEGYVRRGSGSYRSTCYPAAF